MLDTPVWNVTLAGLLGLLVGSFLNVVIHRMPKMLERQWNAECASLAGAAPKEQAAYNLWTPRSACPHCDHAIRWFENIPVLSYVFLKGKCSACGAAISLRYPLVELLTAALFAASISEWGMTPTGWAWCFFGAVLLSLAAIDWDTTLLPDNLTLPLLWAGLCAAALGWIATPLVDAVWGAVVGYTSLWLVFWAFKLVTGKEGMGYGDFKLFAALGTWFGWQALVPIILLASVTGAVVGIGMKIFNQLREGGYVPFGPFLAVAGFTAWWLKPHRLLALVGL